MAMNIKNPRTHELVKQLARLTGQSQEAAVESAVEARLRELLERDEASRILDQGAEIGVLIGLSPGVDPTAELYGEGGLPE